MQPHAASQFDGRLITDSPGRCSTGRTQCGNPGQQFRRTAVAGLEHFLNGAFAQNGCRVTRFHQVKKPPVERFVDLEVTRPARIMRQSAGCHQRNAHTVRQILGYGPAMACPAA